MILVEVMLMYIYLLETEEGGWDSYDGHVVIAHSEDEARRICPIADEGGVWTERKLSTCKIIGSTIIYDEPTVILSSFNAG